MRDKPKTLVIYHKHCADGMCAAIIAKRCLPPDTEFVAAAYGETPPDVAGKVVYLLDFSYKAPQLRQMIEQAQRVIVLDHHKTAEAELQKAWPDAGPPEVVDKFLYTFDATKSGARLTWENFYGGTRPSLLVAYTEDRDLWKWQLPYSKEINAFIRSFPFTLEAYERLDRFLDTGDYVVFDDFNPAVVAGQAILRYEETVRDKLISNAIDVEVQGHKIKMVNAPILQSEIGEKLAIEHGPMALLFWVRSDGTTEFGLRSRSDFDVSVVAKRLGGGGHAQAAGFQHKLPLPFVPTVPGNAEAMEFMAVGNIAASVLQMVDAEGYMANLQMANAWLHDKVRDKMAELVRSAKA